MQQVKDIIKLIIRGLFLVVLFFAIQVIVGLGTKFFSFSSTIYSQYNSLIINILIIVLVNYFILKEKNLTLTALKVKWFVIYTLSASIIILFTALVTPFFENSFIYIPLELTLNNFIKLGFLFILVAISEELFFRKLAFTIFQTSPIAYILLSSIFFTLMHFSNVSILSISNIFIGGLLMAFLYLKTNTIWSSIGFHFGWNLSQAFLGSPVSGNKITLGIQNADNSVAMDSFGFENSIVCITILIIYAVLTIYNLRYNCKFLRIEV